jgi:hypothetical protein
VCYVSDRPAFAYRAGEAVARRLDRQGDMVRVVIPFGHLLVVNGTEPAVQLAVRFYDAERERRLRASRLAAVDRDEDARTIYLKLNAIKEIRKFYAGELSAQRLVAGLK